MSLGHGFHEIPIEWHRISTPSRQKGKKARGEVVNGMEVLVVDSQPKPEDRREDEETGAGQDTEVGVEHLSHSFLSGPQNFGRNLSETRATALMELEGGLEEDLLMDFQELEEVVEEGAGNLDGTEDIRISSSFLTPSKSIHGVRWVDIPMEDEISSGEESPSNQRTRSDPLGAEVLQTNIGIVSAVVGAP